MFRSVDIELAGGLIQRPDYFDMPIVAQQGEIFDGIYVQLVQCNMSEAKNLLGRIKNVC
ncbi:hypothetical protein SAMN05444339_11822 [Loktanella atrilutea]|uniref:Uncharacterized protein n=1 Tax=Loktanella atrilutea TaxID=366533 RepID=A0A1M5F9C4_LOKAT|nr:hypothetical protein [Loktanella atrilutea]SHF88117.1 hypothetical protein SAMN05444339_11822 [Loktanella atrilutea]